MVQPGMEMNLSRELQASPCEEQTSEEKDECGNSILSDDIAQRLPASPCEEHTSEEKDECGTSILSDDIAHALRLYKEGALAFQGEDTCRAKELLLSAVERLEQHPLQRQQEHREPLLDAYNTLGTIFCNWSQHEEAENYLLRAQSLYEEAMRSTNVRCDCQGQGMAISGLSDTVRSDVDVDVQHLELELEEEQVVRKAAVATGGGGDGGNDGVRATAAAAVGAAGAAEAAAQHLQSLYTTTTFLLAQVYCLIGDEEKSASYCGETLGRQLKYRDTFRAVEWAQNATQLSGFYVGRTEYATALSCLRAAAAVLAIRKDDEGGEDVEANIAIGIGKLHLSCLQLSQERMFHEQEEEQEQEKKQNTATTAPCLLPPSSSHLSPSSSLSSVTTPSASDNNTEQSPEQQKDKEDSVVTIIGTNQQHHHHHRPPLEDLTQKQQQQQQQHRDPPPMLTAGKGAGGLSVASNNNSSIIIRKDKPVDDINNGSTTAGNVDIVASGSGGDKMQNVKQQQQQQQKQQQQQEEEEEEEEDGATLSCGGAVPCEVPAANSSSSHNDDGGGDAGGGGAAASSTGTGTGSMGAAAAGGGGDGGRGAAVDLLSCIQDLLLLPLQKQQQERGDDFDAELKALREGGGIVTTYAGAVEHFNTAMAMFKKALEYYVLDGFVTDHFRILMEISRLHKLLAFFEPLPQRRKAIHSRRATRLEPLVEKVNPDAFPALWKQLNYELGCIFREVVELEKESAGDGSLNNNNNKTKAKKKIEAAAEKAAASYRRVLKAIIQPDNEPEFQHEFVMAHFGLARVLHARHDCGGAGGAVSALREKRPGPDGSSSSSSGSVRNTLLHHDFGTPQDPFKQWKSDTRSVLRVGSISGSSKPGLETDIRFLKEALDSYRAVVKYGKRFDLKGMEEQIQFCEELIQLLPSKLDMEAACH